MNTLQLLRLPLLAAALTFAAGSAHAESVAIKSDAKAVAHLQPSKSSKVAGTVQFIPVTGGLRVLAHVTNLSPGEHGFHVHEKGDLSAPDLTSAGGHFNPHAKAHGAPDAAQRHVGDLGNLVANADGTADLDRVDPLISLDGTDSIIGRSVIVHGQADDLKSQPAGNAGPRVAGGVVEAVKK